MTRTKTTFIIQIIFKVVSKIRILLQYFNLLFFIVFAFEVYNNQPELVKCK